MPSQVIFSEPTRVSGMPPDRPERAVRAIHVAGEGCSAATPGQPPAGSALGPCAPARCLAPTRRALTPPRASRHVSRRPNAAARREWPPLRCRRVEVTQSRRCRAGTAHAHTNASTTSPSCPLTATLAQRPRSVLRRVAEPPSLPLRPARALPTAHYCLASSQGVLSPPSSPLYPLEPSRARAHATPLRPTAIAAVKLELTPPAHPTPPPTNPSNW